MFGVRYRRYPIAGFVALCASLLGQTLAAQESAKVDFARDIQPIFRNYCYECHGPSQQMRGLRLDRRRDAIPNRVGANRASIVPGNSAVSPVYLKLTGKQAGLQMPPTGPLSSDLINTVKTWIDEGAEWPDALSGEAPVSTPDPVVGEIASALRGAHRPQFQNIIRMNPRAVNHTGPGGWTPLMYTALYGNADELRLLLDKGANPGTKNDAGGTALMYAVRRIENARVLLEHGADPNAVSGDGRSALLIAAGIGGSAPVVKLLMDRGANASLRLTNGSNALTLAAAAGDNALLQLLLEHGVEPKPLPLAAALTAHCSACFETLFKLAQPGDLPSALSAAARIGDLQLVNRLLDRGAAASPDVLSDVVLSPVTLPAETIKTLIKRGGDPNALAYAGTTVLDLAKRQGNTTLVDLLIQAGAKEKAPYITPVLKPSAVPSVRTAVERSIPGLQRADVSFIAKAGCVSCHNNSLTAMTLTAVRQKGIHVDEDVARSQLHRIASFLGENRERALEGLGIPGRTDTVGYILLGLAGGNYPPDSITDVWAQFMKNSQQPDGYWSLLALRPPLESSEIEVTAAGLRSLQVYAPPSQRAEYEKAVRLAVHWLENAQPKTTEDHVFQILGLTWGKGSRAVIAKAARELVALQNPDGGWSQLASLPSDAYATGQALVALKESLVLATASPAYAKGVRFLMERQLEDGSWYVRSRTVPLQPYFDSDFSHGTDQFISAAATNWASMALANAVR